MTLLPRLQRALDLDPKAGWARLLLGSAHAKLGDHSWRATGGKDDPTPRR